MQERCELSVGQPIGVLAQTDSAQVGLQGLARREERALRLQSASHVDKARRVEPLRRTSVSGEMRQIKVDVRSARHRLEAFAIANPTASRSETRAPARAVSRLTAIMCALLLGAEPMARGPE